MSYTYSKEKKNYTIPIIVVLCILYLLLGIKPLSKELLLTPEWTIDISRETEKPEVSELIPFKLGQNYGYFSKDGKFSLSTSTPFKTAISKNFYCPYTANSKAVEIMNPQMEKTGTINAAGFPFFDDDRIYLMLPGGTGFTKYNNDGTEIFKFENYAPITAFSSSKEGTIAGYSDGIVIAFNNNGEITQRFAPGGSENKTILGAALSNDGKKLACLSGKNTQRFVVAEQNNGHSKIVFHEYIDNQTNRQSLVQFAEDGNHVFYNAENLLGIVNIKKEKSIHIPVKGKVSQIEFYPEDNLSFVLSRDEQEENNKYTITVIEGFKHKTSEFSFEGKNAFIQIKDNALFVGKDSKISKIIISKN